MKVRFLIYFFNLLFVALWLIGYFFLDVPTSLIDEIFFGSVLIVLLFYYINLDRKVNRPMQAIYRQIGKITKGDFSSKIYYNKSDEFGKIVEIINLLTTDINNATDFVKQIGNNKLHTEYKGLKNIKETHKNSLAKALLNMQAHLLKIQEEEQQRNWVNDGLSEFTLLIRNNNDKTITAISELVLSNLIPYAQLHQGAIFITPNSFNEQTDILQMEACYAYTEHKLTNQSVQIGEGLVGQSFMEQKTLYIENIPDNYTHIKSGLGESQPKVIVIIPIKFNNIIEGVFEFCSLHALAPYKIAFLERVAEIFASTITNLKSVRHTKQLLLESKYQTETLQAQEEEMRQNMEELQTTQEEMARKQSEITVMNTRLESNENILKKSIQRMKEKEKETQRLLAETQAQAQALRAQEEEMRQNIEELQATQEEMKRKQKEIDITNVKLVANEKVLIKSFEKSRETENKNKQFIKELEKQAETNKFKEQMLQENITQLKIIKQETDNKQIELEQLAEKLRNELSVCQKEVEASHQKEEKFQQEITKLKAEITLLKRKS